MNATYNTTGNNGNDFDPQQAAALLNQTTQQAKSQLEPFPPWLVAIRAFLALIAYGAIWLSVRGQHPYMHPTSALIPVGIVIGVVNVTAVAVVARRATTGVVGKARFRPVELAVAVAVWIGVLAAMGVLVTEGVSNGIVYGLYPAAAPLIVAGGAWAILKAYQRNWRQAGSAFAAAVIGALSLLAGPRGCWLVCAIGLFVLMLASAAVIARRQHG
jgi:hypothetical protein